MGRRPQEYDIMIKTKSVYAAAEPSDGRRIPVTRYHPRGIRRSAYDAWDRRLAPSPTLLKAYKSGGMKWADFEESPVRELRDSTGGMESLRELREYSRTAVLKHIASCG